MASQPGSAIVAYNIRTLRHKRGFDQSELANMLRIYHTVPQAWNDQKVGELEHTRNGRERNITVDDLIAVSHALGVEVWRLFLPPPINDANGDKFDPAYLDTYSWRMFGMPVGEIRRTANSIVKWPKLQLSSQQTRRIASRHPYARRVRSEWWDKEETAGRKPDVDGWHAATEEAVTACEAILVQLIEDETVEIPDDLIDLTPDSNFSAYVQSADAFWGSLGDDLPYPEGVDR